MRTKSVIKDKLEDDTLDLSVMQLAEVPVKEIALLTKGTTLDLSDNLLTRLPESFSSLSHLVKLDLSKNELRELPDDFGSLKNLKYLDLYCNKLERLPVTFGSLTNLRWLDLKKNPLVPGLLQAAGPCNTNSDCIASAKKVVALMQNFQSQLEQEKEKRILKEKKMIRRRLEMEEIEREKVRAEKKAAKEKRREEAFHKDEENNKKFKENDCSIYQDNSQYWKDEISDKALNNNNDRKESRRGGWCKPFSLALLGLLFVGMWAGGSMLWVYTDGNLNSKSVKEALPLIRRDLNSTLQLGKTKMKYYASEAEKQMTPILNTIQIKVRWAWKEFLRRNDVLARYINTNLGPTFCSVKRTVIKNFSYCASTVRRFWTQHCIPGLSSLGETLWPYFGSLYESALEWSRALLKPLYEALNQYVLK